ncbi:MAG TPA: ABC transporter ATP-binding protein [Candidatus Methanoculleus thermohydrogenotrophicum]|jgi:putative ABC transport system ATP-binding protein|nr:ABC transporter ATP-binding protein [Candidatus Methanoculleus thermohydrogenotrophicum]HPZ38639.1 ABC transporter ATP-binding protein [Candidatus Methanoculleus thermohydrogenotrophicum]HQC91819.1 ABC transporter ATP-binding protein [Candidatus Methanoculleus thermohydrogenotrophicum]
MSHEPVVRFEDVTRIYSLPAGDVVALDHVSLTVEPGEFIAVMGPSGSGKSTLLNLMGCLDVPTTGKIYFSGQDISEMSDDELTLLRRDHIGFVFQQFNLIPLLSALENVEFPIILTAGRGTSRQRATEILRAMNLDDALFSHRPGELSGGQQQRVAIARALANDPDLLLCDEPTGNLDTRTGTAIMDLLAAENRRGKTIVMVTHDPRIADYARRRIQIVDGRLV